MSDEDEEDDDRVSVKGCGQGVKALLNLMLIIISAIHACTLVPPKNIDYIVGADVHTKDPNFIVWYCQNDARFYNCTSDGDETLAPKLPDILGVASNASGELTILFDIDGKYMLGDIHGPKTVVLIASDVKVFDIATNKDGVLLGLCTIKGKVYDCMGDTGQVFDVEIDQVFVALTLSDDTSPKPVLWCYFEVKVQHCKSKK